jgi:hypothetical protein
MEYLQGVARLKYRFHLMDKRGEIRFRYDNAPHHNISTFPHHKHTPDWIVEVSERSFLDVLGGCRANPRLFKGGIQPVPADIFIYTW